MDRMISSGAVEKWMVHLRRQRARANDAIWLIENGATLYDGRKGEPMKDATDRWLCEQKEVVADVDVLMKLYDKANA